MQVLHRYHFMITISVNSILYTFSLPFTGTLWQYKYALLDVNYSENFLHSELKIHCIQYRYILSIKEYFRENRMAVRS